MIKNKIFGENNSEEGKSDIEISTSIKREVLDLLEQKISDEKDLLYYEQVKYFTEDFSFLGQCTDIINAIKGRRERRFTDRESYNRFYSLRASIQGSYDEYNGIIKLLQKKETGNMDRKILNERKKILEQEKNEEQQEMDYTK